MAGIGQNAKHSLLFMSEKEVKNVAEEQEKQIVEEVKTGTEATPKEVEQTNAETETETETKEEPAETSDEKKDEVKNNEEKQPAEEQVIKEEVVALETQEEKADPGKTEEPPADPVKTEEPVADEHKDEIVITEEKEKEGEDEKEEVKIEAGEEVKTEAEKDVKTEAEEEVKAEAEGEVKTEAGEEVKPEATEEVKPKATEEVTSESEEVVREEFDWDSIGKKQDNYSEDERNRLEEVYEKTLSSIAEHEVIEGTVVSKSSREVVVNIGYKSDGIIPVNEFRYNPDLKSGDKIDVYVESQEDIGGQLILSHKKARILKSWERINEAFDNDEIINGFVKCRTKGGLIVDVFGIEAFLPGSQIDVKPIRDYDVFVEKTMEFKVVKINHEYKNVVVSHKALIEAELEQQKAEIMAKLENGQVLEGTVKNITSYGVFIDLGGVDGLIHITDLSWSRINHPDEIVELDQKIKVVILDFDDEKKRIALGLKQLTPHPWDALDENLKVGDPVEGKVVVIADYGAFVEIASGVEGLIHVSEMSWSQHLRTAQDFLKVGDEVKAVVLTLDREERKMSLGMKQLIPDPWENIMDKYPLNSKQKATVRNFTNFGIFVELEEGVDGLIHISDLSWSKKIKHPAEFTKIGESIDVVVLDVDADNRRLSLGHKQLEENPWDVFETVFTVGSIHKGTVTTASDKGFIISLPYGVEGFLPMRHAIKEDGTTVKQDDNLDFKVLEFSKQNKKIILSHSRIHQEETRSAKDKEDSRARRESRTTKRAVKKIHDKLEKTTLGDLEALATLKKDMEKEEKQEKPKAQVKPKKEKEADKKEEKIEEKIEGKKEEKTEEKIEEKSEEKKEEKSEEKKEE